jgi:hypothetical protein
MIITKILETMVDLINPADIYQHDVETMLLQKLNTRYQKRCYLSIYVLEVLRIVRRSSIKMVTNRLDGGAQLSVQFEVSGFIINEGDILHNCKIIEIHTNAITAEHEYVGIKLQKDPNNKISQVLKIGQIIPIVVSRVRYIPNKSKVSMVATPYIPKISEVTYYNITAGISPEQSEKLGMLIDMITEEEKLHTDTVKISKKYQFFQDLMYPYKVNHKYEKSRLAEQLGMKAVSLELKNMLSISNGVIVQPDEDNMSNRRFFHTKKPAVPSNLFAVNIELFPVCATYFKKYLMYLKTLRGFVETYKSQEIMKDLMVYWRMCKGSKS